MRAFVKSLAALLVLGTLSGCAGYEKGNGLSRLDTITPEDKAEASWFKSFYGSSHCHGQYANECEAGAATGADEE